jgi:hypothetical protein
MSFFERSIENAKDPHIFENSEKHFRQTPTMSIHSEGRIDSSQ